MPAQPGAGRSPRTQPTETQPAGTRWAMTQPRDMGDDAARGPGGPRDSRGRRKPARPRGSARRRRWGALQGGLGVCIIVASAAIGAILTMVARNAPGPLLGLFVVAGTVAASLAVRPRTGRMIFPVPVLSYLVAALISGIVFDRSAYSSKTALAIDAAQWIADGFFAMALATVLAVVIIAVRWYLWRRNRPATRDRGWPVPAAGPDRTGPDRTGPPRTGRDRTGADRTGPDRTGTIPAGTGYPAGFAGPGSPQAGGEGGELGVWSDPGPRGPGPRRSPRPGSEPYNFSSGA